ncbi:YraN family protein [bacterium]|nr:YraN family protein [bacterium]
MSNVTVGKHGEELAREFLLKKGFKIVETNKRFSKFCEIDIIALDKNVLVFCEVKTRKTDICGTGLEAITKSKYENIKKGLFYYRQEHPEYKKFRIDVISIILEPKIDIIHLKNV